MKESPGPSPVRRDHISSEWFDQIGNSWYSWLECADRLMQSAQRVWSAEDSRLVWVALMLRGYAVENLLKGLWVFNGGTLSGAGSFHGVAGLKSHQLKSLFMKVDLACEPGTRGDMLDALTNAVLHFGRYPISRKHTQFASHTPTRDVRSSLWCNEHELEFWIVAEELLNRFSWAGIKNDSLTQEELNQIARNRPRQILEGWRGA